MGAKADDEGGARTGESEGGHDEAGQHAGELFRGAAQAEPAVTADLLEIGARTGGNLNPTFIRDGNPVAAFDTRLKTVASIESKIRGNMRDSGVDVQTAAAAIKDNLRYTFVLDPATFGMGVAAIVESLEYAGYRPIRIKDFWRMGDGYAGVNAIWLTPDGKPFEVQFHTQATLDTKEVLSHRLYEQQRALEPGSAEANVIDQEIEEVWRTVRANPPSMKGLDEVRRRFP